MNNDKKIKSLRANLPESEHDELDRICSILDIPMAQIIRESVREKVVYLKTTNPKLQELQTQN